MEDNEQDAGMFGLALLVLLSAIGVWLWMRLDEETRKNAESAARKALDAAEKTARDASRAAQSTIQDVREKVAEKVEPIQIKVEEAIEDVKDRAQEALKDAEEAIIDAGIPVMRGEIEELEATGEPKLDAPGPILQVEPPEAMTPPNEIDIPASALPAEIEGSAQPVEKKRKPRSKVSAPDPLLMVEPPEAMTNPAEADISTSALPAEIDAASAAPVVRPRVEAPEVGDVVGDDDLTRIEGIGPRLRDVLVAGGVKTFSDLSTTSVERLLEILKAAGVRRPGSIGTWAQQAEYAARGDWETLHTYQKTLSGGRKKSDE